MPTVFDSNSLADALMDLGVPPNALRLADNTYVAPSVDWLLGEFFNWYVEDLKQAGLDTWAPDWDCDDFADDFAHAARKAHKVRQRHDKNFFAESTAVFVIELDINQPTITGAHAFILVAQRGDQGDIVFRTFEPQPNAALREYRLSPAELASAFLIR